jgi:hypothetical protein
MKEILFVTGIAAIVVALAVVGLGIKVLLHRNGEFKRPCTSRDPYTGKSNCQCGKISSERCRHKGYSPLEVNSEMLDEIGPTTQEQ